MRAVYELIQPTSQQSIVYRLIDLPAFDAPFHYHPEYELTYILKGDGLRYTGTRIDEFREGELVLLGPNLPHCWLNSPLPEGQRVKAFVIQFRPEVLEKTFFQLPEFDDVKHLLLKANEGVIFDNSAFGEEIEAISKAKPAKQLLILLETLDQLSRQPYRELLNKVYTDDKDQQRFQKVFAYIIAHFREDICLKTLADIANLSPTSFCRYMKNLTGKSLFEIILEYRLQTAAQLLLRTNKRINEIAFESGFQDVPYFNRAFRKWKGISPKAFRG